MAAERDEGQASVFIRGPNAPAPVKQEAAPGAVRPLKLKPELAAAKLEKTNTKPTFPHLHACRENEALPAASQGIICFP